MRRIIELGYLLRVLCFLSNIYCWRPNNGSSKLAWKPQDEMSIFTSHGREEALTTIKMHRSQQQKNAQE
jgi:hypothetical protein